MSFHERLKELLKDEKIGSLERKMGFSKGSLVKVLDENRSIGSDRLVKILYHNPTWNANWLLKGQGPMHEIHINGKIKNDSVTLDGSTVESRENYLRNTIIVLEKLVVTHELLNQKLTRDLEACEDGHKNSLKKH